MDNNEIVKATERALQNLFNEFRDNPSLFYTEHDLASRAYQHIQEELKFLTICDREGNKHYLVHHEWPTPFKCDMSEFGFSIAGDPSINRRGHYDIVVFNPKFVEKSSLTVLRAQEFSNFKKGMAALIASGLNTSPILFGLEFMYNRRPLNGKGSETWFKGIHQDYEKLSQSQTWTLNDNFNNILEVPFMQSFRVVAFDACPCEQTNKMLINTKTTHPYLVYVCPEYEGVS